MHMVMPFLRVKPTIWMPAFTKPMTPLDCRAVEMYYLFEVSKQVKDKKPIISMPVVIQKSCQKL